MRSEFDPGAITGLARLISRARPDLLHYHTSHAITLGTLSGLIAAPFVGRIPAVLTRRVSFSLRRNPLARLKYTYRIDHVIAVADGVRWVLIAEGLSPSRVSVIHSGIEMSRFSSLAETAGIAFRRQLDLPQDGRLVGSVGALVGHKGHRHLLDAMALLTRRRPQLRLAIVGDGPLRPDLEEQARQCGLEGRVHFAGFREDIADLLPAFDVFVLPSISGEGSPAVVKEAMACGVPIVASELDGVCEVVDEGREALLVPPGDPERLGEAIESLLVDGPLRERLTQRAKERVRDFSADRMVERTEEVYARVLEGRRKPGGVKT
jgi:glycosyltransferase involved in cell wall biosynthesis